MWSFGYVSHLVELCDCCSVLSDGGVSGPVIEQHRPHSVCLLFQWGWRHFPGFALLAQHLQWMVREWRRIEWGKGGDREMRWGDRRRELVGYRVRRGEKWMTVSKMETKTFAELRVEHYGLTGRRWTHRRGGEVTPTPRGVEYFVLNFS